MTGCKYNGSVSGDGHVLLTPKLMALGNTIHCVQTPSGGNVNRMMCNYLLSNAQH